jgi:hypothetical protein
MVTSFDKEYKQTKLIKQGKAKFPAEFYELAEWINATYDVKTMNIIYDTIKHDNRPRLQIIFEYLKEAKKFNASPNWDPNKQNAISNQFKLLFSGQSTPNNSIINLFGNSKPYEFENVLVTFSSFEPIAKDEANENIPETKISKLKNDLNINAIWKISRSFSSVTFFFYTKEQVEHYSNSETRKEMTSKYYYLLKEYDEFDYYQIDSFSISLDSKENLDANYQGSFFYYYR